MADVLLETFTRASERMRKNVGLSLSADKKLELYGYYKQATEGPCRTAKPSFFDLTGRAKWEAWHNLGTLSQESSMLSYIEIVNRVDPEWDSSTVDNTTPPKMTKASSSGFGGPVVSTLASPTGEGLITDSDKTMFDWCKEGNVERLRAVVGSDTVNVKDQQGMGLLHWACDRGHLKIVQYLIQNKGADINILDEELQTPLHYASSCGHSDVVSLLLSLGADRTIRDNYGDLAENVCDTDIKSLFLCQDTI